MDHVVGLEHLRGLQHWLAVHCTLLRGQLWRHMCRRADHHSVMLRRFGFVADTCTILI